MTKNRSINLLLIETSTEVCSVAIGVNGEVAAQREIKEHKAHAKVISGFIMEVLDEAKLKISDCSAVVVSEGPGSYTGLKSRGICCKRYLLWCLITAYCRKLP